MNELYKAAIDKITISQETDQKIQNMLNSATNNKKTYTHKKMLTASAVAATFALIIFAIPSTRTAIVNASEYFRRIIMLSNDTQIEAVQQSDNTAVSIDSEALELDRYVDISNNKIYFVLDDIRMDITEKCSDTTYFRYDMTDENGLKHIIFVGGTLDNAGWAEFIFDTDGTYLTNLMHVPDNSNWLIDAEVSIGVPTGIPEIDFAE